MCAMTTGDEQPSTIRAAPRVVHTGPAVVDLVMEVDRFPDVGGDVFASRHAMHAGGGTNVMVAARRAGADVVYASTHGTGPFGDLVRRTLVAEGISIATPASTDGDTGFCVAVTDAEAERTFLSSWGVEARAGAAELRHVEARSGDVVSVTGYSGMHETSAHAVAQYLDALPTGALVVVDPAPVVGDVPAEFLRAVTSRADVWSSNEPEACVLAGRLGLEVGVRDRAALCAALAQRIDGVVVLRVGSDGCFVARPGERARHFPAHRVEAVDTNGAGDAHVGVMCGRLSLGRPLEEAIEWANTAAALAVTRFGPATCPSMREILQRQGHG
ncbi:PfkB family carbohydrate kinase [uncultured Tessaracoccus sp.]|uniref:PfkB family carbohydrate kinase n=1 Tax=uncultured Tessaracoccus sp. TaxID=905023 RepID=UPI0025DBF94E|nr:PfkB family carbohydrate kinase [uncultured Tessaracoccus sp.]